MLKAAQPTGKFGRWGQAGKALGDFWFLTVLGGIVYRLADLPRWTIFTFLVLSFVFSIWRAFFVEKDDRRDAISPSKSESDVPETSA
jgi:hypothetical protein